MSAKDNVKLTGQLKNRKLVNKAPAQAKEFKDEGLYWYTAIAVTLVNASFAQETVFEPDGMEKPHRTQKAFINLMVSPEVLTNGDAGCHPRA